MHKHVRRNSPEAVRELRMINHKVKNQGKINDLRRRMGKMQIAENIGGGFQYNQFHPNARNVENLIRKKSGNKSLGDYEFGGDTFITRNGHHIRDLDANGHAETIKPYLHMLGINKVGEESIPEFLKATGMIRSKMGNGTTSYELAHPPTTEQIETMRKSKYESDSSDENTYIDTHHKSPDEKIVRKMILRYGKQQFAAIPVNEAVIKAFKNKQSLKGRAFESTGSEFKLFGHTIARHHPKGIEASTAGFPTAKTFDTLRALGINTRIQKGITTINGKQVDPNKSDFHLVPHENVLSERVYFSTPEQREKQKQRNKLSGGMVKQRKFREQTRIQSTGHKEAVPLSPTQIQPYDQKVINDITGVKSPIGQPIMGTEAHHIFFKSKYPGLALNPNNSIPQERTEHSLLHRLNKMSQKIALIEPIIMKKKKPKVIRKIDVRSGMIQTAKMIPSDTIIDNFIKSKQNFEGKSGVFDPINNMILDANIPEHKIRLQNLFESGDKNIGFNSITDTRKGQEKDIEKIRSQLREIEKSGGNPALGFDEGSLEALNVIVGNDDDILNNLLEHQRSTGILSPNVEFRIVDNPKFKKLE